MKNVLVFLLLCSVSFVASTAPVVEYSGILAELNNDIGLTLVHAVVLLGLIFGVDIGRWIFRKWAKG